MQNVSVKDYFALDNPGSISFGGSEQAQMFTKILTESLQGVLQYNYYAEGENAGFITASIDGRPWTGTLWSRDVGTFLRELVSFGYFGHAALTARYLMEHCGINEEGYHTFAAHVEPGEIAAGDELDGTCAIIIGFSLLYTSLIALDAPVAKETAEQIATFLTDAQSPVRYILYRVEKTGMLAGSGEFGGGMGTEGNWVNSVQNALAAYALRSWAQVKKKEDAQFAQTCFDAADKLEKLLKTYLVQDDVFIWCVREADMQPDGEVLNTTQNKGFTGINGIGAMSCDVPVPVSNRIMQLAERTYDHLLQQPFRREQFVKYGMYIQFEKLFGGYLTSPSYGQGYALQLVLLLGRYTDAARLFAYMAKATVNPPKEYVLTRHSSYWLYERFLSPDYFRQPLEEQTSGEGCGALNVVNVAEPLKAARLLAGIDCGLQEASPRWIDGVNYIKLRNWPVLENGKLQFINREYNR